MTAWEKNYKPFLDYETFAVFPATHTIIYPSWIAPPWKEPRDPSLQLRSTGVALAVAE